MTPEPTARDLEVGDSVVRQYPDAIVTYRNAVALTIARALAGVRAEWGPLFHRDLTRELGIPEATGLDETMAAVRRLKRVLTLTPEEAGRLYHDVWNEVNGDDPPCNIWPHSPEEEADDIAMGLAFLAALRARWEA